MNLFGQVQATSSPTATPTEPAELPDALRERLDDLDPDGLSPRDALQALYELKDLTND